MARATDLTVRRQARAFDGTDHDVAVGDREDSGNGRKLALLGPQDNLVGRSSAEALLPRPQPVEPDEGQPAGRVAETLLAFSSRPLHVVAVCVRAGRHVVLVREPVGV